MFDAQTELSLSFRVWCPAFAGPMKVRLKADATSVSFVRSLSVKEEVVQVSHVNGHLHKAHRSENDEVHIKTASALYSVTQQEQTARGW